MLLRVVRSCCGQTFEPTPSISFVPWSPKDSATVDPLTQLIAHPTLLGPRTRITNGLLSLMGCILPTMHCRSQHCWEVSHPFAHNCQHGRNNSHHCWPNNVGSCYIRLHVALRNLSDNDDGFMSNNSSPRSRFFSTFLWRPLHDYDVKPPNATFYGGHKHTFSFWSWIKAPKNSTSGGITYIWQIERVQIGAIKFSWVMLSLSLPWSLLRLLSIKEDCIQNVWPSHIQTWIENNSIQRIALGSWEQVLCWFAHGLSFAVTRERGFLLETSPFLLS